MSKHSIARTRRCLGVVRSTADFYWQNRQRQRAVEVLLQAANDSYPVIGAQFRLEAARKASESGQYEASRRLLTQLLSAAPFNEEYLAAMADTYSRAADDEGLKRFSLEKIEEFGKSKLSPGGPYPTDCGFAPRIDPGTHAPQGLRGSG